MDKKLELIGLEELDDVTKKQVESLAHQFTKKIEYKEKEFKKLQISIKRIHKRKKSEKYEIMAKLLADDEYISKETSYDLFSSIHIIFNRFQNEMSS